MTGTVMFEAKNSFAFLSQSYQLESHTLADSRQIQYTAVGSKERQMMLSHEPSYLFGGGQLYIELDSGVVGNVDTMREIRDTLAYAVSDGYRVVNLDETQLVSKAGQGTLLKVLEEAPSGVFFVMCTTSPELLLPTIVSQSR